jgi:hypothetical protein
LLNLKKLPEEEIEIDGDKADNPVLNFGVCEEEIVNCNEYVPEDDYRSDVDPATRK